MGRFNGGMMKVFAYLVVALCVASTLAVVDLDSSLDSIDRPNEDLIEIAENGAVNGARQRVSLDLGEEEAQDYGARLRISRHLGEGDDDDVDELDLDGDRLQEGGLKNSTSSNSTSTGRRRAKGKAKKPTKPTVLSARFRANKAKAKITKALAVSKLAWSNAKAEAKEKVVKGTGGKSKGEEG